MRVKRQGGRAAGRLGFAHKTPSVTRLRAAGGFLGQPPIGRTGVVASTAMIKRWLLSVLLGSMVCGGCGDDRLALPPCQQVGAVWCAKQFSCYSDAERTWLPPTQVECEAKVNASCGTLQQFRCGPQASDGMATMCVKQFGEMSCEMWKATRGDLPFCDLSCPS